MNINLKFLNNKYILWGSFIFLLIYFCVFRWCFLQNNCGFCSKKMKEGFDPNALLYGETNDPKFTKSVNMPITSEYICKNRYI